SGSTPQAEDSLRAGRLPADLSFVARAGIQSLGIQSDGDEGRVNSFLSAFTLDDLSCAEARTGVALFDCHPRSHRVQSLGLAIQRADPLGYSLSLFHVPRHLPDSQSVRNEARCERTDPLWVSDRHCDLLVLRRARRWGGSASCVCHLRACL